MLQGIERLIDLTNATSDAIKDAVRIADLEALGDTPGHFSAVARDGQTLRLARTIGLPLRYFVAKMHHGPFLVVSDRIDTIYEWCERENIAWQFDPLYTRMVPAHYLVEIDQVGCPDPAPRYHRFFNPAIGEGSENIEEAGANYVDAAYRSLKDWISTIPYDEPIAVAFSGGIDSTSVLLLALHALKEIGSDPKRLRAFTLDLGGGKDASQARDVIRRLGIEDQWEIIQRTGERLDMEGAISVIEDYHPLDVECAAAALSLLEGIRDRYPQLKYLIDGDGGDENLKSYPLEDSDLTISSVLRNPLLYQEGWGIDAIKHSLVYSGGLSRAYARTYAPAKRYHFQAFSPYTTRSSIAAALAIPFDKIIGDNIDKLYSLKSEIVSAGVKHLTGNEMPVNPKRRFQDGVGGQSYREWRVGKAWCRQVFLKQWEKRGRKFQEERTRNTRKRTKHANL